jgi:hypothetical protein
MARGGGGSAAASLASLEEGGRARLQERLLFFPDGDEKLDAFRDAFEADPKAPLPELCKRAGLRPAALLAALRAAADTFEREVAKLKATQALPAVIDDLKAHALPRLRRCPRLCTRIDGMGPKTMIRLGADTQVCPECEGNGQYEQESVYKEWATDRLTEITKLRGEKGPLVAVQNNNNTANLSLGAGSGFMEQMIALSDKILQRSPPQAAIVEAEVTTRAALPEGSTPVLPADHPSE